MSDFTDMEQFKHYSRAEWQQLVNAASALLELGVKDENMKAHAVLAAGAAMNILPELDAVQKFVTDWNRLVDEGAIKGGEASKL